MATSENSMGSQPSELSKMRTAEAMPARGRSSDPEKIMSSVFFPRSKP